MLKKLVIGTVLLATSLTSQAGFISLIDGADMAGIEVTAFFGDGSNETQTWGATGIDSGAATSSAWELSLAGKTFGNLVSGTTPSTFVFDGRWVLNNISRLDGIIGFEVNASIADVYFDTVFTTIETATSNVGRPFVADSVNAANVTATMGNQLSLTQPDIFGTLNVDWLGGASLASGQEMSFFIDTDKKVPEPATSLMFLSGLLAFVGLRRKKA